MTKTLLIQPRSSIKFAYFRGSLPPLGLLSIATHLKKKHPQIDLEIIDEDLTGKEYTKERIQNAKPVFIGISTIFSSYKRALEIARMAKGGGAKTILGGIHASTIAKEALSKRKFIDGIIKLDGERAFTEYVEGRNPGKIKNLVWRDKERVIENENGLLDLNKLPFPDYSLIDFSKYKERWQKVKKYFPVKSKALAAIYSQRGCLWRKKTDGCLFCTMPDKDYLTRNPKQVWSNIEKIVSEQGVDFIWDISDSLITDKRWFREFVKAKPKDLNPNMRLYSRATDINQETARLLSGINCYEVFLGIESGDVGCLQRMAKGGTPKQNLEAVRLLSKYNISTRGTMVLGAPGETKESLENTLRHTEQLYQNGAFHLHGCILEPVQGTTAFSMMMEIPELKKKYSGKDYIDPHELKIDWVKNFCKVSYKDLIKAEKKLFSMVNIPASGAFLTHKEYRGM